MKDFTITKIKDIMLILLFCVCIIVPGALMFSQETNDISAQEKRSRASLPVFTVSRYSDSMFQEDFQSYFNDHFGLRDALVSYDSSLLYHVFRTSSNEKALVGNNGWLFYSAEDMLNEYLHGNTLTATDLENIATYLTQQKNIFEQQGIQFVVLVAPDKETIYPEQMPRRVPASHDVSTRETFVGYLTANTDVLIVDPTEQLRAVKNRGRLYYAYDSHWTELGAAVAYELLQQSIKPSIASPELPAPFFETDSQEKDLADLLFIGDQVSEHVLKSSVEVDPLIQSRFTRYDNDVMILAGDVHDPCMHAVLLRDSFGIQLLPFLAQDFCTLTILRDYDDNAFIFEQHPDIVILEIVERNIPRLTRGEAASPR